ncbi:MAG: transglutaminase domain-containing protein [Minisyncoccia bacterium]
MKISPTKSGGSENAIKKATISVLLASLILSPVVQIYAQEINSDVSTSTAIVDDTDSLNSASTTTPNTDVIITDPTPQVDTPPEPTGDAVIENHSSTSTPEEDLELVPAIPIDESLSTTNISTSTEVVQEETSKKEPKEKTLFKKDNSKSQAEQLSAVRQHLIDQELPQNIIDRLDAYEKRQEEGPKEDGILKKVFNFFTGNTDSDKEQKRVEKLAKKQPFKVEGFDGNIRTANESAFEELFPNQKEQSTGLLKRIKNFIKNGSTENINFDGTEDVKPLSWLIATKAIAQASSNPNDYLAEGGEITFSQAIQDQAEDLNNDPLTILNFVRNDIEYVPYYGSKKGADATLIERAGNDMDKASLLISMLRDSNIPARYRHVDIQTDLSTVIDLLGVNSAIAAAEMLSLHDIPYILFTDENGAPLFFVIEHTYVEAYMQYGYSRGANPNDGGPSQWVPMDPTINTYYYEQPIDIIGGMKDEDFDAEDFFDNYLDGDYGTTTEPLAAFKEEVEAYLATSSPEYYSGLTYNDALMRSYPRNQNLSFVPGTLPYHVAADLNTYDYLPTSLRHTIEFTVNDDEETQILNYTAYVSDLADKEILVTFDAATAGDQTTINSFGSIYDVVPLSLVAVYTKIKINGTNFATSTATTTLGQLQNYTMEFGVPIREIGGSISSSIINTVDRDVIAGNTDAIALDTDRILSPEFRPEEDTETTSFVGNQVLYKTALDYLQRLENTQGELASIVGSDFTDVATRATIFNGIEVTYSLGEPYSFDWNGLRIDSSSFVRYFSRFNDSIDTYKKEFTSVFGLQGSQDESDIFEDNFNVESVATVKGLKLVADGAFGGVTLHKITQANENDIDTLSVSTSTRNIFHTAVDDGKTVYTPSAPFTYEDWTGLVYITIDFDEGVAGYIIGEGLNGGYTVEQFPAGWSNFFINIGGSFSTLTANIITPTNDQNFIQSSVTTIPWRVQYTATFNGTPISGWEDNLSLPTYAFPTGSVTLRSGYGTADSVNVQIVTRSLGSKNSVLGNTYPGFDDIFFNYSDTYDIPADLLKSMAFQESCCVYDDTFKQKIFDPNAYRYEAHKDYDWYSGPFQDAEDRIKRHPDWHFAIGGTALHGSVTQGNQAPSVSEYREWGFHMGGHSKTGLVVPGTDKPTAQQLLERYQDGNWIKYKGPSEDWNFTAQLLLASSYGMLQAMYETALTRMVTLGLETKVTGGGAQSVPEANVPIQQLFNADFSVKIGAGYLKHQYDSNNQNWFEALKAYNGGGPAAEQYATEVLDRWNSGNGMFKEIIE